MTTPAPPSGGTAPSASGGTLLGTNQLQSTIDKFTSAVSTLDRVVGSLAATPTGFGRASAGNGTSAQQQPAYGSFPNVQNPFQGSGYIKPVMRYNNATGQTAPTGGYYFNYSGGGGQPGQPVANGGGSTPGGPRGSAFGLPATFGASVGTLAGAARNFGSGQLPTQVAMSTYVQQGTLAAPNGMSNATASAILRGRAFGNGSSTLNAIANNASDAMQGQALINWASGGFAGANSMGGAMQGAANMFGYTNQGLGYLGSASMSQQLYSPQMSMRLLQMGYQVTPRTMGGGPARSGPTVLGGMMSTWYQGRRSVSQQVLNAGLAPGGNVYNNLVYGMGLSGQNLTSMESTLQAYNKLANAGYSNSTINSLFAGARNDNQGAINKLTAAGITQSDLQVLKNRTAAQTGSTSNELNGFSAGLRQSVGLLTQFNKILSAITGSPLGSVLGYSGGVGAAMNLAKTGGPLGSLMSGGAGLLTSLPGALGSVAKIFGGAGGGGATTSQMSASKAGPSMSAASGVSGAAKAAVGWAEKEVGVPYVWGGDTPQGFDCSGLTMWAYGKAGIKIPRTSQQQWAAFQNRSVPLNSAREGDLVFNAGQGDGGTFSSPGHVAMMISNGQIIEAPHTGADVRIRAYNPNEWQHAARPTGSGAMGTGPGGSGANGGNSTSSTSGAGMIGGGISSTSEADNIMAALGGTGGANGGTNGGITTSTNGTSGGGPSSSAPKAPSSVSGAVAIGKKMAAARGWTGKNWDSLYALWQGESGWRWNALNKQSGAYGVPQALPASKMASAGADWRTNAATQERWGMGYIDSVYGNPSNAYQKWLSRNPHWYGQGTRNARRGPAVVGDRGPEVVWMNGGEGVAPLGQASSALLNSAKRGISGGGVSISLQFSNGAIQIGGAAGGSDASHSAREFVSQVGRALQQEDVIRQIAAGVS